MYTGIVQGISRLLSIIPNIGYTSICLSNEEHLFDNVQVGASVSVDGTCLTVTSFDSNVASFDISDRTTEITTLKTLKVGSLMNVERSHKMMLENGGHNLYGHIDGVAEVVSIENNGGTAKLIIEVPEEASPYFFRKCFIGLHGCSLTVDEMDEQRHLLTVNLIPETLRITNLAQKNVGDQLNYEIDQTTRSIVDTIKRVLTKSS